VGYVTVKSFHLSLSSQSPPPSVSSHAQSSFYLSICHLWVYSSCGPWLLFEFLNLYIVGRTPWMGDQPVTRPLPTHRTTQTQNKLTQISMPRVGFELTIPVFEWAKTVHALECAAAVTCQSSFYVTLFLTCWSPLISQASSLAFSFMFHVQNCLWDSDFVFKTCPFHLILLLIYF
jgi:hypothetical protein